MGQEEEEEEEADEKEVDGDCMRGDGQLQQQQQQDQEKQAAQVAIASHPHPTPSLSAPLPLQFPLRFPFSVRGQAVFPCGPPSASHLSIAPLPRLPLLFPLIYIPPPLRPLPFAPTAAAAGAPPFSPSPCPPLLSPPIPLPLLSSPPSPLPCHAPLP